MDAQHLLWRNEVEGKHVGCFIIDPPMGLASKTGSFNDKRWELEDLINLVTFIASTCAAPYTIVLYSIYSIYEVQQALEETQKAAYYGPVKLYVYSFIMVKVSSLYCNNITLVHTLSQLKTPCQTSQHTQTLTHKPSYTNPETL